MAGLVPREYAGGRPSRLTTDQRAALLEKLQEREGWTTAEVQHLIQSHFGIRYSLNQIRRILRSFGMHQEKTHKRTHCQRADAEGQRRETT